MSNLSTTSWVDEKTTDLAEVERLLLSPHNDEHSKTSLSYINWNVTKRLEQNKRMVFNGKETEFNCFHYSFEQFSVGMEDDTVKKEGYIIPYLNNGKIRYIVTRNTGAKTMLRKLLAYTGRNVIKSGPVQLSADLFVWLISKVYKGENIIVSESESLKDLSIDSIRGIKGDTEDLLTKVSAVGESVINIISTLSFLLESQKLNQIKLAINYGNHKNIDMSLSTKNVVALDFDRYQGEYLHLKSEEERIATLFVLLYMEVLPIIIQGYVGEIESKQLGPGKCVEFLQGVAEDLSEKVKKRVDDLTNRPEQLNADVSEETADID